MLSNGSFDTLDGIKCTSGLTKSEALGDEEVFEVVDFSNTTERVLLTEGTLRDEEFIGETGESPGGLTVGEYT